MTEQEVYSILKNNTNVEDHGEHEWDNSWLGVGIKNSAEILNERRYTLLGWFTLTQPKISLMGITLDIGVVCEDEYGERFWCHYAKEWLEDDIKTYEERKND